MKVMCAVCGRPVERLTHWSDIHRQVYTIIAECHGDREEMFVADEDLVDCPDLASAIESGTGVAFARKQIAA